MNTAQGIRLLSLLPTTLPTAIAALLLVSVSALAQDDEPEPEKMRLNQRPSAKMTPQTTPRITMGRPKKLNSVCETLPRDSEPSAPAMPSAIPSRIVQLRFAK